MNAPPVQTEPRADATGDVLSSIRQMISRDSPSGTGLRAQGAQTGDPTPLLGEFPQHVANRVARDGRPQPGLGLMRSVASGTSARAAASDTAARQGDAPGSAPDEHASSGAANPAPPPARISIGPVLSGMSHETSGTDQQPCECAAGPAVSAHPAAASWPGTFPLSAEHVAPCGDPALPASLPGARPAHHKREALQPGNSAGAETLDSPIIANGDITVQTCPNDDIGPLHHHTATALAVPTRPAEAVPAAPETEDDNPLRALLRKAVRDELEREMRRRLDDDLRRMIRAELSDALSEALVRPRMA